jgi:hypothetical protein
LLNEIMEQFHDITGSADDRSLISKALSAEFADAFQAIAEAFLRITAAAIDVTATHG